MGRRKEIDKTEMENRKGKSQKQKVADEKGGRVETKILEEKGNKRGDGGRAEDPDEDFLEEDFDVLPGRR